jgi:methyl-accepting chemotaxis protein
MIRKAAVEGIVSVSNVIKTTNDISMLRNRNATTIEMSGNVSGAAQGSNEITSNIAAVAQAAETRSRALGDTLKAAQELVDAFPELEGLLGQFKIASNGSSDAGHSEPHGLHVQDPLVD